MSRFIESISKCAVPDKDIIKNEVILYLSEAKSGSTGKVDLGRIVNAVLHKLKPDLWLAMIKALTVTFAGKIKF